MPIQSSTKSMFKPHYNVTFYFSSHKKIDVPLKIMHCDRITHVVCIGIRQFPWGNRSCRGSHVRWVYRRPHSRTAAVRKGRTGGQWGRLSRSADRGSRRGRYTACRRPAYNILRSGTSRICLHTATFQTYINSLSH